MSKRQSKTSLREMLTSTELKIDGELNAPAMLMRKMMYTMAIKPMEWERMTTAYYKKKWGDDVKKIREEKSNLATSLEQDQISWSRFEQFLQIISPESVNFTVSLNYPKDITLDTSVAIRFKRRGSKADPEVSTILNRMAGDDDDDVDDDGETNIE